MLDDEFKATRARLVRDLAEQADPYTKERLLNLAVRYEPSTKPTRPPVVSLNDQTPSQG